MFTLFWSHKLIECFHYTRRMPKLKMVYKEKKTTRDRSLDFGCLNLIFISDGGSVVSCLYDRKKEAYSGMEDFYRPIFWQQIYAFQLKTYFKIIIT